MALQVQSLNYAQERDQGREILRKPWYNLVTEEIMTTAGTTINPVRDSSRFITAHSKHVHVNPEKCKSAAQWLFTQWKV